MHELTTLQLIAVWALPVILAVTLHEASHGYVAYYYGDKTAYLNGRLSLNPIRHMDPIGTVAIPGLLLLLGAPFIFGWAKPVPVKSRNLKNPRKDMAMIAIAGPLSNLMMALFWALTCKIATIIQSDWASQPMFLMGFAGIQINLVLMLLNLLPLPPLDGSKVLNRFLRGRAAIIYDQIEPYGFFILVFLIITGVLSWILKPIFINCIYLIISLFNL